MAGSDLEVLASLWFGGCWYPRVRASEGSIRSMMANLFEIRSLSEGMMSMTSLVDGSWF